MKFALISHLVPPSSTGQSLVIYRMLSGLDPKDYFLISSTDYGDEAMPNYSGRLPGKYYHLQQPFQFTRGTRFGLYVARNWINLALAALLRARQIARIVRRQKC